jgi:hypothetical protein
LPLPFLYSAVAIPALEKEENIKAYLDGTVAALLASMDRSASTNRFPAPLPPARNNLPLS